VTPTTVSLAWATDAPGSSDPPGSVTYTLLRQGPSDSSFVSVVSGLTDPNYTDSGLTPATAYQYEVIATDAGGDSPASQPISAATYADLGLTATGVSASEIDLTWTAPPAPATGIVLERSTDGINFMPVSGASSITTSWTNYNDSDPALTENTPYDYELVVTGVNPYSTSTDAVEGDTLPAVSDLVATAISTSEIDLSWTNNAPDASGYIVQESADGNTWTTIKTITDPAQTTYRDSGHTANTAYAYQVCAVRADGNSDYSLPAGGTTLAGPPTNLTASDGSSGEIDLSWTDTDPNLTGFDIQQSTDGGTTYETVASIDATSTTYADVDVADGTTYRYQILADNAGGSSAPSGSASATSDLAAPSDLALDFNPSQYQGVELNWTNNSDSATYFLLQRSNDGTDFTTVLSTSGLTTDLVDTTVNGFWWAPTTSNIGTTLYYQVVASNGISSSAASNVVSTSTAPTIVLSGAGTTEYAPFTLHVTPTFNGPDPISSMAINWGDGTTDTPTSTSGSFMHTYNIAGTYSILVTAQTDAGPVDASTTAAITPRTMSISGSLPGGQGTGTITASFGQSTAADVSGYTIDWGDGTIQAEPGNAGPTFTHTYAAAGYRDLMPAGFYTVNVEATTLHDGILLASTSWTDGTNQQPGSWQPWFYVVGNLGEAFATYPTSQLQPVETGLNTVTIETGGSQQLPTGYSVNFGDGTAPVMVSASTPYYAVSHSYATEGLYNVTVTAAVDGSTQWTPVLVSPIGSLGTLNPSTGGVALSHVPTIGQLTVPSSITPGNGVDLSATVTGVDPTGTPSAYVNWGDGNGFVPASMTLVGTTANPSYLPPTELATYTVTAHLAHAPGGVSYGTLEVCNTPSAASAVTAAFTLNASVSLSLVPHRTGGNFGQVVTPDVVASLDPSKYVILTNNNFDDNNAQPDYDLQTANLPQNGTGGDPDLAQITLDQIPDMGSGTIQLSVLSAPGDISALNDIAIFKSDGTLLYRAGQTSISALTLDLAHPSGYLAGLTSGNVDIWVEGLQACPDLQISLRYSNFAGYNIWGLPNSSSTSTIVAMDIVNWDFVDQSGDAVTSVGRDAEQLFVDELNGDTGLPAAAPDTFFKSQFEGLAALTVGSVVATSDTVSTDSFVDTLNSYSGMLVSADYASLYTPSDGELDLTPAQISQMQSEFNLNALHNADGTVTLKTASGLDQQSRTVTGKAQDDATTLYNLMTQGSYGGEIQFVLDRMDWQNNGTDWHKRLVFQPMKSKNFESFLGTIYVNTGGTDAQTREWAIDGLREWAGNGVRVGVGDSIFGGNYFAQIARLWAKHFYYQGPNFDQEPGVRYTTPPTLNPPDPNAAADSLSTTFDFLYYFSQGGSNTPTVAMYPAVWGATYAVPEIYCWIFAGHAYAADIVGTVAEVNIPSKFGMNLDWWEADSTGHNRAVNYDPITGTWPYEDQTHHFAGYFEWGTYVFHTNMLLSAALWKTGDYPKKNNPGDYNLGILGFDIGYAYSQNPGFYGSQILADVQESANAAFLASGRINDLP
jgi:fibronectin type 3 domain-containing protein